MALNKFYKQRRQEELQYQLETNQKLVNYYNYQKNKAQFNSETNFKIQTKQNPQLYRYRESHGQKQKNSKIFSCNVYEGQWRY